MKISVVIFAIALCVCTWSGSVRAQDVVVGVSWSDFHAERWETDEVAIKAALSAAGAGYLAADAGASVTKQISDIEQLVAYGADAVIVLATDVKALEAVVRDVIDQNIPVIAYDRLIEHPLAFYVTFNNREVGRMQARSLVAMHPSGNYAFIKGPDTDPNSKFLFSGQLEVLVDALAAGDIVNVGEAEIMDWRQEIAQAEMERILSENDNEIDAVVASNDTTAAGVIAAVEARGLTGSIAVSGQDAEHAALNRIAYGAQTATVWKDARALGKRAGEIAAFLARGGGMDEVEGVVRFSGGPTGVEVHSYFLAPVLITRQNLDLVIESGWATRDMVCLGIEPGMAPACDY